MGETAVVTTPDTVNLIGGFMKYFSQALLNFLADAGLIAFIVGAVGCFFTYVFKNAGEEVFMKRKMEPAIPWFVNLFFNLGFTFLMISTASMMANTEALKTIISAKTDLLTNIYYMIEIWIFSFIISVIFYITFIKSLNTGKDIWINYTEERKAKSEIKVLEAKIELMKKKDLLRELVKEQIIQQTIVNKDQQT